MAAEDSLPIKARIVRCVTQQERAAMCASESLCCALLDNLIADQNTTTTEPSSHQQTNTGISETTATQISMQTLYFQ